MKTISKASKFTPQDAATLDALAAQQGVTASELINLAVGRMATEAGLPWEGKQAAWGDPLRFRLSQVHISVSDGRAHVARMVAQRDAWAANWEALEDDALAEVEAQGGFATLSAVYACSPGLAQRATWE